MRGQSHDDILYGQTPVRTAGPEALNDQQHQMLSILADFAGQNGLSCDDALDHYNQAGNAYLRLPDAHKTIQDLCQLGYAEVVDTKGFRGMYRRYGPTESGHDLLNRG